MNLMIKMNEIHVMVMWSTFCPIKHMYTHQQIQLFMSLLQSQEVEKDSKTTTSAMLNEAISRLAAIQLKQKEVLARQTQLVPILAQPTPPEQPWQQVRNNSRQDATETNERKLQKIETQRGGYSSRSRYHRHGR